MVTEKTKCANVEMISSAVCIDLYSLLLGSLCFYLNEAIC